MEIILYSRAWIQQIERRTMPIFRERRLRWTRACRDAQTGRLFPVYYPSLPHPSQWVSNLQILEIPRVLCHLFSSKTVEYPYNPALIKKVAAKATIA